MHLPLPGPPALRRRRLNPSARHPSSVALAEQAAKFRFELLSGKLILDVAVPADFDVADPGGCGSWVVHGSRALCEQKRRAA